MDFWSPKIVPPVAPITMIPMEVGYAEARIWRSLYKLTIYNAYPFRVKI